jgi:hypothetical protein
MRFPHEDTDRHGALLEVHCVLNPDGVLSITEAFLDPDYALARTAICRTREAGFRFGERHDNGFV